MLVAASRMLDVYAGSPTILGGAAGESPRSNRKELKKSTTLFRLSSACICRLYLLHRENKDPERVKEGEHTGCGS
jgi:hypothetical protein